MRKTWTSCFPILLLGFLCGCSTTPAADETKPAATKLVATTSPADEIEAARALFAANIKAIQDKDRDAYLASYRQDEHLVRAGIDGPKLGFAELAEGTAASGSEEWPSRLDATEVELFWVAPGVVYGTYRYDVTIAGATTTGLSERVFLRRGDRWEIAVTSAFEGTRSQQSEDGGTPANPAGTPDAGPSDG